MKTRNNRQLFLHSISTGITSFLLILGSIFLFCSATPKTAQAAEFTTAETINVNTPVTDKTGENIKYYSFTATEDGYFVVSVRHMDISETGRWYMVLQNKDRNYTYESKYGESILSQKWPCIKGKTYYIDLSNSYAAANQTYELLVTQTAEANWEREENDTQESATSLSCDVPMSGNAEKDRSDWFKLEAPATAGYIIFTLVHPDIAETGSWTMTIQDASGTKYGDYSGSSITSIKYGFQPGTALYVKITANYGSDCQLYTLKAAFTPAETFESEPNNNATEADNIAYNTDYYGILSSASKDTDYYQFTNPSAGKVTFRFGPVDISNAGTWQITLVNAAGKEVSLMSTKTTQDVTALLKKGTYYLKVTNDWDAFDKEYTFRLSRKNFNLSGKTKIAKVRLTNRHVIKSLKLSKRVKNAEKYLVKVSRKKKMSYASTKEMDNAKTLSIEFYGYYKTKYYIQVRPYIDDAFGDRWYGKKSNIVKIKTKRL